MKRLIAAVIAALALPTFATENCPGSTKPCDAPPIPGCVPGSPCPTTAPTCLPGYVWQESMQRCDNPTGVSLVCRLTFEWSGLEAPRLVELTPDLSCQDTAALANAQLQVRLLGGR